MSLESQRMSYLELDDAPAQSAPAVIVAPPAPVRAIEAEHVPAPTVATVARPDAFGMGGISARATGTVRSAVDLLKPADLDWEPEIVPLVTADGIALPKETGQCVVRSDTRAPLGVVGAKYHAIPHRVLATLADAIVGQTGDALRFGNAGHRGNGARPFLQLATAPEKVGSGRNARDVELMISLFTSHDGTLCLTAGFSSTVIVCRNTYAHALGDAKSGLKIKHTVSAAQLLEQAESVLNAAGEYAGAWSNAALRMMSTPMTEQQMRALASVLIPGESKRSENARGEMLSAWESSPGAMPGTVFGAAQAVTYYTSHVVGRTQEAREDAAIFGTGIAAEIQASAWMILDTDEETMTRKLATVSVLRA